MSLFPYGIFWYLTPWRSGESSGLCPGASDQWIGHTPYTTKVRAPCPHFPLCSFFFWSTCSSKMLQSKEAADTYKPRNEKTDASYKLRLQDFSPTLEFAGRNSLQCIWNTFWQYRFWSKKDRVFLLHLLVCDSRKVTWSPWDSVPYL